MLSFFEKYEKFKKEKGIGEQILCQKDSFDISRIANLYRSGDLSIKNYQRAYTYGEKRWRKASKVIETILLKRLIPSVVLLSKNGKYEIIDGQQRILSVIKFLDNDFKLNLSGQYDELKMLDGKYRRDLGEEIYREISFYNLNILIIDEEQLTKNDEYFATKVFLDLNVDPIPVSKADIIMNFSYSPLVKEVKNLTKEIGIEPEKVVIWKLFAYGTFKKNGSFRKLVKDKKGGMNLRILYLMLSFIDEEIKSKEIDWIKKISMKAINEQVIYDNKIDKFEKISKIIDSIYFLKKDTSKINTPFFAFIENKNNNKKLEYLAELADIFYISLKYNIEKFDNDFILKNRNTIKLRFDEIKKELINKKDTDNYFSFVNVQKEEFKHFLNDL